MTTITESEIIQILTDWSAYLSNSNLIYYLFRWLGWAIVKGLVFLCNACESLLDSFYGTLNFFADDNVQNLISGIKPILWILFGISLIMLFYMLILRGGKNERGKVLINILLAVLIISSLPTVMTEVNNLTYAGISYMRSSEGSTGEQIVQSNVDDLMLVNELNFDMDKFRNNTVTNEHGQEFKAGNNITTANILDIDITESVDPNKLEKKDYKAVFENKVMINYNGTVLIDKIPSPPLGIAFLGSYYFRYHVDWLPVFISLISMILAVFFTGYKTVRITFELAVYGFLAPLIAVTDISTGERIKQVLRAIFSSFAVLFFTSALLKLYMFAVYYFSSALADAPLAMAFAQLFTAIAVIDGPNLFERILGIDIGLNSGIRNTVAVLHGTRMAIHTASRTLASPFRMFRHTSSHTSSSQSASGSGNSGNTSENDNDRRGSSENNHNPPPGTTGSRWDSTGDSIPADSPYQSQPQPQSSPVSTASSTENTKHTVFSDDPSSPHTGHTESRDESASSSNTPSLPKDSINAHLGEAYKSVDKMLSPSQLPDRKNPSPYRRKNPSRRKDDHNR